MTTAFYTDLGSTLHTLPGHPEHAGRLQSVVERLDKTGLIAQMKRVTARTITDEDLLRIHTQAYLSLLESTRNYDQTMMMGPDTYLVPESYDISRETAGGALAVVDAVLGGTADNGLVAARPPGHHATPSHGMGFCLLNNIALAAQYAREVFDLERVAIVDYDVHHGNGTQDTFYHDPAVLFISSHQMPLYPGTGGFKEMGEADGYGYTLNIPVMPQMGDSALQTFYQTLAIPALERFKPQLILVSAGFDSHWRDPLANLNLSLSGLADLTQQLCDAAQELCGGKIIFVMEGGYDLEVLAQGVENVVHKLLNDKVVSDPIGPPKHEKPVNEQAVARMKTDHPVFQ